MFCWCETWNGFGSTFKIKGIRNGYVKKNHESFIQFNFSGVGGETDKGWAPFCVTEGNCDGRKDIRK